MLLLPVTSWLDRQEREILAYLIEENRVLRRQLGGRCLQLTDNNRWRLGARAYGLGRPVLRTVAMIVTPDTLLRWLWLPRSRSGGAPQGQACGRA